MNKNSILLLITFLFMTCSKNHPVEPNPYGIVIHGGCGRIIKENMTPEAEQRYMDALLSAVESGHAVLKNGGSSLDAVQAAIVIMEDSPLFNAGRGAVFTSEGKNEMDASIMDGSNLNAGAVSAVRHIKNPVILARIVMEKTPHVLLSADGALACAREHGLETADDAYFFTPRRWNSLQKARDKNTKIESGKSQLFSEKNFYYGTVGAVALDKNGNLAAATSTGGKTNKKAGRVGDAAIIGAGTYANNNTCAVSATGDGEFFIRGVIAYDISAMIKYNNYDLQQAVQIAITEKLAGFEGDGGIIAIDANGQIVINFNTQGMYRAYIKNDQKPVVKLYKE